MKFLVATDFSENSTHAVKFAANLAMAAGAEIVLVNSWHIMPVGAGIEEVGMVQNLKEVEEDSRINLDKTVQNLEKEYPVFGRTISRQGFATEVLQEVYDDIKPDLVVAGRRGMGAVSRAIFGSVSSRLVDSKMRPMLIVPEDAPIEDLKEVIFLSDFYDSDVANLKALIKLVEPKNAKVNVMHFHTSRHEKDVDKAFFEHFEGVIRDRIAYNKFHFEMEDTDDLHEALEEHIDKKQAQLLVIASMHRTFWQQLVDPSLTKHLIKKAQIPVLIFDAHNDNLDELM